MKVLSIAGARPNFMKVAPIMEALTRHPHRFVQCLVHTGQHYDDQMSGSFFSELGLPKPDYNLGVGSGTHAEQTGKIMIAVEPVLRDFSPDLVIVVGDVNSTFACAVTAKKLNLRVAHVEAGLRSFDFTMPEEINRLCTDAISDDLFTTDRIANENLRREGISEDRIHFVGNVMIDSLLRHVEAARHRAFGATLGLKPRSYATLTLHRPSNVDRREKLVELLDTIAEALSDFPILFPVHPRTRERIEKFGLQQRFTRDPNECGLHLMQPLGYLDFLGLNTEARIIVTDSGGLQEEATVLGVPCITLRENTERPITILEGTNRLAGTTPDGIRNAIREALSSESAPRRPEKWDGRASHRIADILASRAPAP
jgi:UDP-N-acetylglucosamine 2-epimerase (non-hydrolysing)